MYSSAVLVVVALLLTLENVPRASEAFLLKMAEEDRAVVEGDGYIQVQVIKTGAIVADITVTLNVYTYSQFESLGYTLPAKAIDPAELNDPVTGRSDFTPLEVNITFPGPDTALVSEFVNISITTDDIDEPEEGFVAVITINNDTIAPVDLANLESIRDRTFLMIVDDDDLTIGFERDSYSFEEKAGRVEQEIYIVKENNTLSEQVFFVNLLVTDISAELGRDFLLDAPTPVLFSFPTDVQRVAVPIEIVQDMIAETNEEAELLLTRPDISDPFDAGLFLTRVVILDDEMIRIGFEQTLYEVEEAQGASVEVCATVFEPPEIDKVILVSFFTLNNTAVDGADFEEVTRTLFFRQLNRRICIILPIVDDALIEADENFTVVLEKTDTSLTRVTISPDVATIVIVDREPSPTPTTFPSPSSSSLPDGVATFIRATPNPTPPVASTPQVLCNCPDISVAIGITFLITLLVVALIAAIICVAIISAFTKRATKSLAPPIVAGGHQQLVQQSSLR